MVTHNRHPRTFDRLLAELAALWGVQTGYRDSGGSRRESPPESVLAVLAALGAGRDQGLPAGGVRGLGGPADEQSLRHAIASRKAAAADGLVEPVVVAWEGVLPPLAVPSDAGPVRLTLLLEDGREERWEVATERTGTGERRALATRSGRPWVPSGYHRLCVEAGSKKGEAVVISAPRRCWPAGRVSPGASSRDAWSAGGRSEDAAPARPWGVFAPLYALRSERDWGAGDLADLGELRDVVQGAGGNVIATLPLLAAYLECPFEPCPYSPVSRLFWNEFFLAPDQTPEWELCAPARAVWREGHTQDRVTRLRAEPLVDYAGVMALKRAVLSELSRCFFSRAGSEPQEAFAAYLATHPEAFGYAAFRARVETWGADWREQPYAGAGFGEGPAPWSLSGLSEGERYHLYCQWQMDEQLARLAGRRAAGACEQTNGPDGDLPGLFLDLPVGVHPGGFDTWRWRESFVEGMSVGAPPDAFFSGGQDWDSPPLHPERIRESGHQYFARCLQAHMSHASWLRIDHVMSLHRLFLVPEGRGPGEGVYVTYPAEELYAVVCLESHRHRTVVVGEDLGTVPPGVRAAMRRHGVLGTWVLQSSLRPRAPQPIGPVPPHVVAALGTHDMVPFAGFVRGDDIDARVEWGRLDGRRQFRERRARARLVDRLAGFLAGDDAAGARPEQTPGSTPAASTQGAATPAVGAVAGLLRAALAYLGRSQAALVLVNLEDLLLETRPQNRPGTGQERANWRGKVAATLAEFKGLIAFWR